MRSTADLIEAYLSDLLAKSANGVIEVQRSDLAELFSCVPSQINYVIATRFTLERGYIVESKRGGGGYIRIRRAATVDLSEMKQLIRDVGDRIAQREAEGILWRLETDGVLSSREASMLRTAISRDVLVLPLPERDMLRARLLAAMLAAVYMHRDGKSG
ncbi:CtsR family transcriptional regulator [Sulfoacidibacillus thermotolerans]|uniref:Transcriptional regulator CtsR n=1 Tax=Sulfoacidibacillus thermotolerans TaxID=1765684 RepID=A0A2U3DBF7_SULT2|nr:CtsR family transcriptional regulator [Sulfoacidibacillus thermotolerans]PWI58592.1 transcriptional regulator [Sulfoacidibacillus thermotolerans]